MADTDDDVRFGYYLTDFMDADPAPFSLSGWAQFLAGNTMWHDRGPLAKHHETFNGWRMTFRYAPATYGEDGWEIPEPPPGHVYHAVAYASGDGWDEDGMGDSLAAILGILLTCDTDGEQWIVFRQTAETPMTFRFLADIPQLLAEASQ